MVIHIQIGKCYAGLKLRIGDVDSQIEHSNITKKEVLSDIKDALDEFDDGHDINCEGSMCYCESRQNNRNKDSKGDAKMNKINELLRVVEARLVMPWEGTLTHTTETVKRLMKRLGM